jgi:hypothetical protein
MNILSNVVLKFSHLTEQRILITAQNTVLHTFIETGILLIMTLNVKNVCFYGCTVHSYRNIVTLPPQRPPYL